MSDTSDPGYGNSRELEEGELERSINDQSPERGSFMSWAASWLPGSSTPMASSTAAASATQRSMGGGMNSVTPRQEIVRGTLAQQGSRFNAPHTGQIYNDQQGNSAWSTNSDSHSGIMNRNNNPFIRKKRMENMIVEVGEEAIPFNAIKEIFKYEFFVTHIHPDEDIEVIKRHVCGKLGIDVIFRCLSKRGAPWLSFGVFCSSESDSLDFKLPGLWPRGTMIYKWKQRTDTGRYVNHPSTNQGYSATPQRGGGGRYQHRRRLQNNGPNMYKYPSADQQRLHDQYN